MHLTLLSGLFLAIFCSSSLIHLICCFRGSAGSAKTKPLLISSLALFYLFAAEEPSMILFAALLASWAGDVLLMPSGNKWFVAGGVSFLISHVLFIFVYVPHILWERVAWPIVIPAACVYAAVSAGVMLSIRKDTPKAMIAPMFLYLAANSAMNLFALMMLISSPAAGPALAYAGAVCFFTSDSVLFLSRYHKKKNSIPKRGFIIMLTYILGEALIAFGMLLR